MPVLQDRCKIRLAARIGQSSTRVSLLSFFGVDSQNGRPYIPPPRIKILKQVPPRALRPCTRVGAACGGQAERACRLGTGGDDLMATRKRWLRKPWLRKVAT